jgi:hypothetical protein
MSIKENGQEIEIRCLKLTMSKEKRDIIQNAIDLCKSIARKEGQAIDDSRALEFIAAEFLSTYQNEVNPIKEI